MEETKKLTTQEKALQINLSRAIYGSFAEVGGGGAEFDAAAVARIDVAVAIELAGIHQVQRNLAGGIEVVPAEKKTLSKPRSWAQTNIEPNPPYPTS